MNCTIIGEYQLKRYNLLGSFSLLPCFYNISAHFRQQTIWPWILRSQQVWLPGQERHQKLRGMCQKITGIIIISILLTMMSFYHFPIDGATDSSLWLLIHNTLLYLFDLIEVIVCARRTGPLREMPSDPFLSVNIDMWLTNDYHELLEHKKPWIHESKIMILIKIFSSWFNVIKNLKPHTSVIYRVFNRPILSR